MLEGRKRIALRIFSFFFKLEPEPDLQFFKPAPAKICRFCNTDHNAFLFLFNHECSTVNHSYTVESKSGKTNLAI